MQISDIIHKKRLGNPVSTKEINRFVQGIADFSISDGEIAAFAMAASINGLSIEETTNLTAELIKSGIILNWDDLADAVKITDIYSTLGVGNKLNIIVPPILAALGCFVPKIGESSGVNYSGYGTLDKIVSIRGYNAAPSLPYLYKFIKKTRCAIIGPNEELVPVERRFYPIRCLISANTSPAFTTASMLSRSICSGIKSLTININVGKGSLYQDMDTAKEVADYIFAVANNFNLPVTIVYSNSNYILGKNVGNSLELREVIEYFKTSIEERDPFVHTLVLETAGRALILNNLAANMDEAKLKIESVLISGLALDILATMIYKLGGPEDFDAYPDAYLITSKIKKEITSENAGYISEIDPFKIGQMTRELMNKGFKKSKIDHGAGFSEIKNVGTKVEKGDTVAFIHGNDEKMIDEFILEFKKHTKISPTKPVLESLIIKTDERPFS